MDQIIRFFDLFARLDQHLGNLILEYSYWTYLIIFVVILLEGTPVLMPLLPGGALVMAAGTCAARGWLDVGWLLLLISAAAAGGDSSTYLLGHVLAPHIFRKGGGRIRNEQNLERAHAYYVRYGPITLLLARFIPFVRAAAPAVAGMAKMGYSHFLIYNSGGCIIWTAVFLFLGYFLGHIPWVGTHMPLIIIVVVSLPALPLVVRYFRRRRAPVP